MSRESRVAVSPYSSLSSHCTLLDKCSGGQPLSTRSVQSRGAAQLCFVSLPPRAQYLPGHAPAAASDGPHVEIKLSGIPPRVTSWELAVLNARQCFLSEFHSGNESQPNAVRPNLTPPPVACALPREEGEADYRESDLALCASPAAIRSAFLQSLFTFRGMREQSFASFAIRQVCSRMVTYAVVPRCFPKCAFVFRLEMSTARSSRHEDVVVCGTKRERSPQPPPQRSAAKLQLMNGADGVNQRDGYVIHAVPYQSFSQLNLSSADVRSLLTSVPCHLFQAEWVMNDCMSRSSNDAECTARPWALRTLCYSDHLAKVLTVAGALAAGEVALQSESCVVDVLLESCPPVFSSADSSGWTSCVIVSLYSLPAPKQRETELPFGLRIASFYEAQHSLRICVVMVSERSMELQWAVISVTDASHVVTGTLDELLDLQRKSFL